MKKIVFVFLLLAFSVCTMAQKNVALLETLNGDKKVQVKGIELNMVRGELRKAISTQNGFRAYTRTDIDQLMKEHGFQNSGMVAEAQRKKLGEMYGADYICVSTLTKSSNQFYIEAYLIDVETGEIFNPASKYGILKDGTYANLYQLCQDLAGELVGYVGGSSKGKVQRSKDYIETAFGINMKLVYVDGGTFTMGCTSEQSGDCNSDESPTRETTVSSFYIGMLEVTQSQWEKVMGTSIYNQMSKVRGSKNWGIGSDYPMYYISYGDAKEFCDRLSRQTGKTYRLPTEAEWEFAARGGNKNDGTKYSGGSNADEVAWYIDNGESVHTCGTKRPNALGIYDMSGSMWEWCEDWYSDKYMQYDNNDPKGASSGYGRVLRGGSWCSIVKSCRVARRNYNSPNSRDYDYGFRIVLVP